MSLKVGDKVVFMDARFSSDIRYNIGKVVEILDTPHTYRVQDDSILPTAWRATDDYATDDEWLVLPLQVAKDVANHILEQVKMIDTAKKPIDKPLDVKASTKDLTSIKSDRIAPADHYYSSHYAKHPLQPIELMQMVMSPAEFIGFLKGNIIKYADRAGNKAGEPVEKEMSKIKRYKEWLDKAVKGETINPRV